MCSHLFAVRFIDYIKFRINTLRNEVGLLTYKTIRKAAVLCCLLCFQVVGLVTVYSVPLDSPQEGIVRIGPIPGSVGHIQSHIHHSRFNSKHNSQGVCDCINRSDSTLTSNISSTVCLSSCGKTNQLSSSFTFERRALCQKTTTNLILQNGDYGLAPRLFSQPKTTNECISSIQVSGFQQIKLKTKTGHLHSIYLFDNMATACHSIEQQIQIPIYPDSNHPTFQAPAVGSQLHMFEKSKISQRLNQVVNNSSSQTWGLNH